jgi:hypothetical protein
MSDGAPVCPCDRFDHPRVPYNPPGRDQLDYRVGDFLTFRRALLAARATERVLLNWRPGARTDLALQLVEWWAYLADVLTFYNERVANESYLRTADLPTSVQGLVRILGYRPRPGIGARGVLAALVNGQQSFVLPQGFQIQSKPGPGKQPQIFELDEAVSIHPPDAVETADPLDPALVAADQSLLLKGSVPTVQAQDTLVVRQKAGNNIIAVRVTGVRPEPDPRGKANTRVTWTLLAGVSVPGAQAADYRLQRSAQTAQVWQYADKSKVLDGSNIHLDSIYRNVQVGDPVFLRAGNPQVFVVERVTAVTEVVWFANPLSQTRPDQPPAPPAGQIAIAIPIPHTRITVTTTLPSTMTMPTNVLSTWRVDFGWQDVGELIGKPLGQVTQSTTSLRAGSRPFPLGANRPILIEDGAGPGAAARASVTVPDSLSLSYAPGQTVDLTPPLRLLFNLLPVSRGQSVSGEVLGSGDATQANQEFVLQKSPLTYLLSTDPGSGETYRSTLRIWVDGVEWQEVPSFFEQPPDARIFITREDEAQKTHVLVGDGVNGARLPSGVNNIVASYRYGGGKDAPDAGQLTVVVQPYPGLKAVRNPVAVGGGADPDPSAHIRRYAPRSVLTFGRAISADDYETIAAQTPGVTRARSYWVWDAAEQRALVAVYVGDDSSAAGAARQALARAADPNRPVDVRLATAVPIRLGLTLLVSPDRVPADAVAAVRTNFLDPDNGLFGANVARIGLTIFRSEIYETCLDIPGVLAVHGLQVYVKVGSSFVLQTGYRYVPGEGGFFQLATADLNIYSEVAARAG